MHQFKHSVKPDGDSLDLTFEGAIDEDVVFPVIDLTSAKKINIDLKAITSINSVGIREWLDWIRPLADKALVTLVNCPKAIVFQFNMVEGFLPAKAVVGSFFIPFFCEKCDREDNVLVKTGNEVTVSDGVAKVDFGGKPPVNCKQASCEMEMDVTEAKYFQFLKRA
jgi:hypothetical protein